MILHVTDDGTLFAVLQAPVRQVDGTLIFATGNSHEVASYLKAHPDSIFLLSPGGPVREIHVQPGEDPRNYQPGQGHIYCGQVRHDSSVGLH